MGVAGGRCVHIDFLYKIVYNISLMSYETLETPADVLVVEETEILVNLEEDQDESTPGRVRRAIMACAFSN